MSSLEMLTAPKTFWLTKLNAISPRLSRKAGLCAYSGLNLTPEWRGTSEIDELAKNVAFTERMANELHFWRNVTPKGTRSIGGGGRRPD
ncbi:hypothetical protein EVAR_19740_1 [Eumeta japonica]|uniref:Uncharacterized protein n=1 Tax=Eumeta variegata TaxID=151549 RepID=A0A4C1UQV4_EUMVA|nr:hypothetical protein EVAR_19740_1 [Eumeta japonica]